MTELLVGTKKGLFALSGEPGGPFEVTAVLDVNREFPQDFYQPTARVPVEEFEGRLSFVPSEGPDREARQIVGLLLGQVRPIGRDRHQPVEHGPECLEVPSLEDRVDGLDSFHELFARVADHVHP